MKNTSLSTIYILLATVCWGSIGLTTRPLLAMGFASIHLTLLRCALTAVILILFSALCKREALKISGLKNLVLFVANGVIGVACMYLLFFKTIDTTTVSLASVLLNTAPCFVLVISCIIFKEKITAKKLISLFLAITGCIMTTGLISTLSGGAGVVSPTGVLVGAGSGLCYAMYTIISNQLLKSYSSLTVITYSFLFGALCMIPVCEFNTIKTVCNQNSDAIIYILAMSLICTLLPYVLYTFGLNHMEPGKASIMALAEPMVATLISIFYFKEGYTVTGLLGIVLIFVSIILLNTHSRKNRGKESLC